MPLPATLDSSAFLIQPPLSAGSLNADLLPALNVGMYPCLSLQISGTWSGTLTIQVTNDPVNGPWVTGSAVKLSSGSVVGGISSNDILVIIPLASYARVRMTSYTSGTANATIVQFAYPMPILASQFSSWTVQPGNTPNTTPWLANPNTPYPSGATPITASSGNVANAAAIATLAGTSGKTTYIAGFKITGSGATAGLPVIVTITGVISGTMSYIYSAIAGVLVENTPLIIDFVPAIPASAANTNIVVTCPALGAGNTNNTANAHGYQL